MDAMQILVIILSIFLAAFLILAIVLIVELLRVTRQIKSIATTTQTAVERVSNFASSAGKLVSPALIMKFFNEQMKKHTKKTKKEED